MPPWLKLRLVISFVLAVVCFCGSTLYTESNSRSIDVSALSIAQNAMPTIQEVSEMRAELRHFDALITDWVRLRRPDDAEEAERVRMRVDDAFERYLALPDPYPGEGPLRAELHHGLARLSHSCTSVLANGRGPDKPTIDGTQCHAAITGALDGLVRIVDLNAAAARQLAWKIENRHQSASRIALFLDLLSTLFTATAAWLTLRALAQHHRVVDERNRLAARRAEELEQFAGRVAHDVLGPLSATRLALGSVDTRVNDADVKRMLARGQRGIDRVATIVDGLLRFARAGARPEPGIVTSVPPVIEGLVTDLEPVATAAGITLTVTPTPVPRCSVLGNAGVLVSVLENLVRNAVKYMGERPVRRVELRIDARREVVRFEVHDTGPGIASAMLEQVFQPHVRLQQRQPGIGLGLATVKRIADAHGGRVGVQSRLDVGSVFWVELPRADIDDATISASPSVNALSG